MNKNLTHTMIHTVTKASLVTAVLLAPAAASAHHPGALGPINHLGLQQILAVAFAALLDGMNPTALGVLLLILWQGVRQEKSARKIGVYYVLGIISTYLFVGILLRSVYLNFGPSLVVQGLQALLALFLFASGLNELSEAVKPREKRLIIVPDSFKKGLSKVTGWMEKGFAYPLGMLVGFIELFATGAIYLTFIQAITYDPTARWWVLLTLLAIYLVIFSLPMLAALIYKPLVEILMDKKSVTKASRTARGVVGLLFMAAAAFIAASAYITVQSSVNLWWF